MSNQTSSSRSGRLHFTEALAVVALVLLGVLGYFGLMFRSGGVFATSLLWSVGTVAALAACLVFMARAKRQVGDTKSWRVVEYVLLGLYVVVAALTFRGPVQFISVMTSKSDMQAAGNKDISNVCALFDDYESFERRAISTMHTGLLATIGNSSVAPEVTQTMERLAILPTQESIEGYCEEQTAFLLGDDYEAEKDDVQQRLTDYAELIEGWNIFRLPSIGQRLEREAEEAASLLTERSARAKLPNFGKRGGVCDVIAESQTATFEAPTMRFAQRLSQCDYRNALAWGGWLLLHALALLHYLLLGRSNRVRVSGKRHGDVDLGEEFGPR